MVKYFISLNHITTQRCDVPLIILHVLGCLCFSDINIWNISQITR